MSEQNQGGICRLLCPVLRAQKENMGEATSQVYRCFFIRDLYKHSIFVTWIKNLNCRLEEWHYCWVFSSPRIISVSMNIQVPTNAFLIAVIDKWNCFGFFFLQDSGSGYLTYGCTGSDISWINYIYGPCLQNVNYIFEDNNWRYMFLNINFNYRIFSKISFSKRLFTCKEL